MVLSLVILGFSGFLLTAGKTRMKCNKKGVPMLVDPRQTRLVGYLMVLLAALSFSLIGPISRYPMAHGVSPMEAAFWRALGEYFLLCTVLQLGHDNNLRNKEWFFLYLAFRG